MEEEASSRPSKKARGAAASGLMEYRRWWSEPAEPRVLAGVHLRRAVSALSGGGGGARHHPGRAPRRARCGVARRARRVRPNGVAERALADRSGSGAPLVAFACGLWHEKTVALKPRTRSPGKARKRINRWVSKATNDLITSILPPGSVHSLTGLVIANAIYFTGRWSMPFNERDTETRQFHLLDGSTVDAPFMCSRRDQAIALHEGFKVLKLAYHPYRIPHWEDAYLHHARDGLPELVEKMASRPSFLWDHLPKERSKTRVWLPKFKLSFSGRINGILKAMGMEARPTSLACWRARSLW
ncbi:unnamed protein product [Urochloa decumbens]|uniref:Serpin domain-containing protein n=1 Tax=Urochloa decumbens TaxID=240449 RepID=A0ABC8VKW3_9POAL